MATSVPRMKPSIVKKKKKRFLDQLAKCGLYTAARDRAGVSAKKAKQWREDPEFQAQCDAAIREYVEVLEKEADRRAIEGVAEPVFYEGEIVGTKQRFSDQLLQFRLKGLHPDRYKDRVENSGGGGGAAINIYLPENGRK